MSGNAIVQHETLADILTIPGEVTRTALQLVPGLPFQQWEEVGRRLRQVRESSLRWWLGDWLNYGERGYGEEYSQALEETDYSRATLHNIAWVCRRFEPSRRHEGLSFTHHQEIAGLGRDDQDRLLVEARRQGWSARELRAQASARQDAHGGGDGEGLFEGGDWGLGSVSPPAPETAPITVPDVVAFIRENPEALAEVKKAVKAVQDSESVHFSSESVQWYTPRPIVRAVEGFFDAIDLDPCAQPGTKTIPAAQYFTEEDDGLARHWWGRVYMNPPYGREIGAWIEKACAAYESREIEAAILLVPARTDTAWWQRMRDYPVCLVDGRIHFIHPEGKDGPASFPSALVYLGDELARFALAFADLGDIWVRYQGEAA